MGVQGRSELVKLIEKYSCISPFDSSLLDGDGYVLTVKEEMTLHYLEHRNLISNEVVFTTPFHVAHLTAKSKYGRMGLSFLNAAKVHSGFVGRLALELVNLSNDRSSIIIKRGDPLMHIEFITRDGEPSPYTGEYQFQYLTDEETEVYLRLIELNFSENFQLDQLRRMAKQRVHAEEPSIQKGVPVKPGA